MDDERSQPILRTAQQGCEFTIVTPAPLSPADQSEARRVDLTLILNQHGGIARTQQLLREGVTRTDLVRAISSGQIRRIDRGWYATARVPSAVVEAVRSGGRVGCATALELQGVWMIHDERIHVCITTHGAARPRPGVIIHWRPGKTSGYPMDGVGDALEQLARCRPLAEVVVAADSALNRGLASEAEVLTALSASARGRRAIRFLNGSSESGLESLARLALMKRGIGVTAQAHIDGVGFVDLLIGDRLVLELDGETWHRGPDYEKDRERDGILIAADYLVIRCSYRQVMENWQETEERIVALVRRREHLWRSPHELLGHAPRSYRRSRRSIG